MWATVSGCLFGLREFCYTPLGLWRMHIKIKNVSSRHRGPITDYTTVPYNDQALRRQKISAAIGERRPSTVQSEQSCGSSIEHASLTPVNILNLLCRIWFINVVLVFVMWLFFRVFSSIAQFTIGQWLWSFLSIRCICGLVAFILQNFIFLLMELVNIIYLKKICDRITSVQQQRRFVPACRGAEEAGSRLRESSLVRGLANTAPSAFITTSTSTTAATISYGIGKPLMDCVYSIVFFMIYRLQWRLLSILVPIFLVKFFINSVSLSFTYACYAFEYYARQTTDATVDILLAQIIAYWPVFVGYGLPLGVLVSLSPNSFGWSDLLIAFLYPVLMVGAFQVSWSKALDPTQHRASALLRFVVTLSMKPALYCTNVFISLFASCLSYHCKLFHRGPGGVKSS